MTKKKKTSVATNEMSIQKHEYDLKNIFPSSKKLFKDFEQWCGFGLHEIMNFEKFTKLMYRPTDPASLGVARILFGLCMVLDIVEERGLADIDLKWGDPYSCHFPLIHGMKPPSLPWMILLFTLMWIGAFGIMLGFCFKLACACFVIPYWYIFLLDKSFWNNHSYLYGIVALLFWGTDANRYFALDTNLSKKYEKNETKIPLWNYFIIKFQFFTLYFLAGLKKSSREWLEGYSMTNLSHHWVFDPFKLLLTTEQTDFYIVHWCGFIFDLTVGFFMLFDITRMPAMIFCATFHFMNSRLFSIGMFPYVCLATMPLFCHVDWPRKMIKNVQTFVNDVKNGINNYSFYFKSKSRIKNYDKPTLFNYKNKNEGDKDETIIHNKIYLNNDAENNEEKTINNNEIDRNKLKDLNLEKNNSENDENGNTIEEFTKEKNKKPTKKQKFLVSLLLVHIILQLFLPYSHFITKGYNNWVPGLYGYSWDMMVHSWDTILIVVRVHDNENNEDHFVDPQAWVQNDKWSKHGDMVIQYTQCLKNNLLRRKEEVLRSPKNSKEVKEWSRLSSNLSIYIDVRCSLNGRFQQRVFNPNVDMLTVDWHPLKPVSFLMPLLSQFSSYRYKMDEITRKVYTWSNYTDVLFIADYPGMQLENYFSDDFTNVSLTVLEGEVNYAEDDWEEKVTVRSDHSVPITTGKLHQITTTSVYPSCYMYTYTNQTREQLEINGNLQPTRQRSGFPIVKELKYKVSAWWRALGHIANAFFYIVYDVPMIRRIPRALNYHEDY